MLYKRETSAKKRAASFEWGDRDYHLPFGARETPYPPLTPIVQGAYRAARDLTIKGKTQPAIAGRVEVRKGGWFRGVATLDNKPVYVGRWVRKREDAWDYVRSSMLCIREGLDYER